MPNEDKDIQKDVGELMYNSKLALGVGSTMYLLMFALDEKKSDLPRIAKASIPPALTVIFLILIAAVYFKKTLLAARDRESLAALRQRNGSRKQAPESDSLLNATPQPQSLNRLTN